LWALQESAGFRSAPSARGSDVCSTVRCYLALKETGALETQEDFGTRVLDYVLSRKPADRLWDLDTETYIPDGASGQIIFTQNSTSEILEFLASIGGAYESQLALVSWFQHNQNRDGSWCLGANSHIRREVMTWSTNEVVIALSQFVRAMSVPLELQPPQPATPSLTNARWDLAILCALEDIELKAVLRLPWHWEPYAEFDSTDGSSYYVGRVTNKHGQILRVLAVAAPQMGMPAMAVLAMKVIEHFRPIYLATTGIAAAVKKAPDINFGDVLFAEFSWDYGSGKLTVEKGKASLSPDPRPIPADSDLRKHFVAIKNNASALATIRDDWPGVKPATVLNIHLGPVASGAAVVADEKIVSDILVQHRKLIGIEMEIYGLFYAARHCIAPRPTALAIKSVCDYGDREKSDRYQPYAAYTSARVLDLFVREHLAIE
jgi:nucleoside phosphorylase